MKNIKSYDWRDKKDADGNTIPHEDEEIKENKSDWRETYMRSVGKVMKRKE